ncbi:MAG: PilZ domain-containing protein [Candidatus Competibacteraceae bacterium]|nr:PilZ domain-containing protein [Candidatus Competibacteraceae bacterium]
MTVNPAQPTASGLVFTGRRPLAWRETPALPDAIELHELERANLINLHTLFALDIHAGDSGDDPVALANATELKRLDFKVGLLLELVGQLYARQQDIPPQRTLTLAVSGLSWQDETAPPVGGLVRIELYCNLSYPRPLICHARTVETTQNPGGWRIRSCFQDPSEPLQEALERYIFLQHRRAVAHSRRGSAR